MGPAILSSGVMDDSETEGRPAMSKTGEVCRMENQLFWQVLRIRMLWQSEDKRIRTESLNSRDEAVVQGEDLQSVTGGAVFVFGNSIGVGKRSSWKRRARGFDDTQHMEVENSTVGKRIGDVEAEVLGKLGRYAKDLDMWNQQKSRHLRKQLQKLRKEMTTVSNNLENYSWSYLRQLEQQLEALSQQNLETLADGLPP
ncbi:hypothetical protein ACOSP7_032697 [Xanthoceras sorbifolium]